MLVRLEAPSFLHAVFTFVSEFVSGASKRASIFAVYAQPYICHLVHALLHEILLFYFVSLTGNMPSSQFPGAGTE